MPSSFRVGPGMQMRLRRTLVAFAAIAVGPAALLTAQPALSSCSAPASPIFAPPTYVDATRAGGEPMVPAGRRRCSRDVDASSLL